MRVSTSKVMLAVLVVGLWSPVASAQVSKARPQFEIVKDRAERLNDLVGRRDTEEQAILRTTRELSEACMSACDAVARLFEPLAEAASGEHETRLKAPSKLAKNLAYLLVGDRELIDNCRVVMKLINTERKDRDKDFSNKLESAMTTVIVGARARSRDWAELTRTSEETLKWLRESLKEAQARCDNPRQAGAALDATMIRLATKKHEQDREVQRLIGFLTECESRELDAYEKLTKTITAQNEAWLAPASPSKPEKVKEAYEKRLVAENAHDDAHLRSGYARANLVRAQMEQHARDKEYTKSREDVRKFMRESKPETLAKRVAEFERWTDLLEKELKR